MTKQAAGWISLSSSLNACFSILSHSLLIVSFASSHDHTTHDAFQPQIFQKNLIWPSLTNDLIINQGLQFALTLHAYKACFLSKSPSGTTHPPTHTHIPAHVKVIPPRWKHHVQGAYWAESIDLLQRPGFHTPALFSVSVSTSLPVLSTLFQCNWFPSHQAVLSREVVLLWPPQKPWIEDRENTNTCSALSLLSTCNKAVVLQDHTAVASCLECIMQLVHLSGGCWEMTLV